jgi:peroxiredoxin
MDAHRNRRKYIESRNTQLQEVILLAAILLILSSPLEGYTADPYIIFEQADSVLSSVSTVEYSFSFSGTGALSNIIPVLTGTTCLSLVSSVQHPLMVHRFETTADSDTGYTADSPLYFAATQDSVFMVNHSASTVYGAEYSEEACSIFDFPPSSLMMEFVLPEPFRDEILSDSIAVLYPVELDGVWCHVLHVYYDRAEKTEAIWLIAMNDLLPRAVERLGYYGTDSVVGGQYLELTSINTCSSAPVSPEIPEDYTVLQWKTLLSPGEPAPEFFLADTYGTTLRSTQLEGRYFLLCFFASWNTSSLSALGLLKSISSEYSDLVQTVGISIMEISDPGFRLNSLNLGYPVLIFGDQTAHDYNVHTVPAVFLVSKEREILYSSSRVTSESAGEIRSLIEERI